MQLKTILIISGIVILAVIISLRIVKKLPDSVVKFLIFLSIMLVLFIGVALLKRALITKHRWN